jgi:uncharacterized protein YciI
MHVRTVAVSLLALALFTVDVGAPASADDIDLVQTLGADEHGMKMYALVLLKSGPRQDLAREDSDRVFAGHMANINRLTATGDLVFAGPLEKNDRYRGIFIFNVRTSAEARALLATDPAVQAGALAGDVYLLYGSAALQQVTAMHRTLTKD